MTDKWTTRVPPEFTQLFGEAELHAATFQPEGDRGGPGNCTAIAIPETPKEKIAEAMTASTAFAWRVLFICDTEAQANEVATLAASMLPKHRRISFERAMAGEWFPV